MYLFKIIKLLVITFLFFLLVLSHFSGTITGDEEKVYNFIDSFLKSKLQFTAWLQDPIQNCEIWKKCHNAFLQHNLAWFFVNLIFFKISELLFFFKNFLEDRILIEMSISFFNTLLFWLSFIFLYKEFSKKYSYKICLASIILVVYGTYINNLASGGYIETIILFLLSLRLVFLQKERLETKDYILIALIDSFLICLRFFYFWAAIIFLIINLNFLKIKNVKLFYYFVVLITLLSSFYILQSIIPSNAYLNTNELKDLSLFDYYLIKIQRSFCFDSILGLLFVYIERIYNSFFSLSVGLFFIFPIFVLTFFAKNKKILIAKYIMLFGFICAFSLEQNFYLPAGIAGHRGLAPLLIIFLPEIIENLEKLSKSKNKLTYMMIFSFLILLFTPSLYYRSTLAHYTIFTKNFMKNNNVTDTNLVLVTEEKIPKCYRKESFTHTSPGMHPGILGWSVLISKELKFETIHVPSKLGKREILLKDFPPQTIIHRSKYLLSSNFHNYENNILKKYITDFPILVILINLVYYLFLLIFFITPTLLFIYFFRNK